MSSIEYQNILDEYKQQIPDDLYIKLSRINMQKHIEEGKSFYELTIAYPKFFYDNECSLICDIGFDKKIFQLDVGQLKIIEKHRIPGNFLNMSTECLFGHDIYKSFSGVNKTVDWENDLEQCSLLEIDLRSRIVHIKKLKE